jgi:hypothetical protein
MTIVLNGTTGISNDGGYTGDGVVFADTTPANTLVTTTGGNVGIGTSSPGTKLVVGALATGTLDATYKGNIRIQGFETTLESQGGLELKMTEDGYGAKIQTLSSGGTNLVFATRNASATWAERARIDPSGNLLVGTTGAVLTTARATFKASSGAAIVSAVNNNTNLFCVNENNTSWDAVSFRYFTSTEVGRIACTSTATSYVTSSDYRLKENVQPMTGALAKVTALKPCTYTWKADGSAGQGFIAHELQAVVPDAVSGEKDAVNEDGSIKAQGIDTSFLVATLTAAIQEQQAIITEQEVKMGQLVDQLTNAESTMNLLTEMFTESQQTVAALTARVEALEGTQP